MKEHILKFLRHERNLTPFEISEILSVSLDDIKRYLMEFGIDKNPSNRKYILIRKQPMTNEQKEFLVGEIISGAFISKHGKYSNRILLRSKNKRDILWKKIYLGNFVNVILENNDGYSFSINHNDLCALKNILYIGNKKIIPIDLKYFSDVTIASIYFNIAKQHKETIRISLTKYDKESVINLQSLFRIQGIRTKVCEYLRNNRKYWYLSINKRNSLILYDKIKYILNFYNDMFNLDSQRLHAKHYKNNDDIV